MENNHHVLQVPAVSAGTRSSKRNKKSGKSRSTAKPKYRDMILNAIRANGDAKGTNFQSIASYLEKKYKMKNDFIVKHTLKWLVNKKYLSGKGGRYRIATPLMPSAGRRSRKRGGGGKKKRRGKKKGKKGKKGRKGRKKRKKGKKRRRGGKKSKKGKRKRGGRRRRGRKGRKGKKGKRKRR